MVERLFESLEGKSLAHQDSLIFLIVEGIKHLELKPNDNKSKEKYGFLNSSKLRKQFLDYLFFVLLLPYSQNTNKPLVTTSTTITATPGNPPMSLLPQTPQTSTPSAPASEIPACLSESIYKRLKNDINIENGDELEQV